MRDATAPTGTGMVATAIAWVALVGGALAVAFSLPIDDFWLSLATAREMRLGSNPALAGVGTWLPILPDAINPQWGAQLLLGASDSLGWALAVNAACLGAGLLLTVQRARHRADPTATAIGLFVLIAAVAPYLLAQAQSFSIALVPAALLLLERKPMPRWLPLAYGLLMVAWANLHGAFVLGQAFAVVFFVGELLAARRGDPAARPVIGAALAFVGVLAPLVNPVGARLLAYAYAQPTLDVVREISTVWQPAWPWTPIATITWLAVLALVIGRIRRRGGIGFNEAVIGLLVIGLAASGIRHVPWVLLALTPLLAEDVNLVLAARPRLAGLLGQVRGWLGDQRARGVMVVVLLLAVGFQFARPSLPAGSARLTPDAPVEIADYLDLGVGTYVPLPAANQRILNEQAWGGYLAWRLPDRVVSAMDGRLEIRSRQTWVEYFALIHGEGDPAAVLAANDVRWVAVRHDRTQLIAALMAAGWIEALSASEGVLLHSPPL